MTSTKIGHNESFQVLLGKVIMDIENMQNQLFFERSDEFLKEFPLKRDDYKQWIFKELEELLGEKNSKYIVISPLYSSFITQWSYISNG